jgi:5-methylcytosine-specific restriction endonuclease McrA
MINTPSAEEQIRFLNNIQRLFTEGGFTATYKYALLMALADLSVELEPHPGAAAIFRIENIAEKFIEYYWNHAAPYISASSSGGVLFQNVNPEKGALILKYVQEMQAISGASLSAARRNKKLWNSYVRKVARLIEIMPLNKLQTVGNEPFCFLYDNPDVRSYGGNLQLKPGVAFHFRRLYPLIRLMIQEGWIRYIRELKANRHLLGTVNDLGEFLFGSNRQDLSVFRQILHPIQEGRCFYCSRTLSGDSSDVDHFIPWTRYSLDLAHNFVLAHSSCNSNKRDFLPDIPHLERWMARNKTRESYLRETFDGANLLHDLNASIHITRWAYEQAELSGASVWSAKDIVRPLTSEWKSLIDI